MGQIVAVEYRVDDVARQELAFQVGSVSVEVGTYTDLKAGSENLVIYGSGRLAETLRAAGLIDEYRLLICPIVRGEGRKLFTGATSTKFTVTDSSTAPSGMALLTLETV